MSSSPAALLNDVRTLWHLAVTRGRGPSHVARLESFYSAQADNYDNFRRRLLHGRDQLIDTLTPPEGGVWIDFGAGTGENAQRFGGRLQQLQQAWLVDLCPSLLRVARQRVEAHGWQNVAVIEGDATSWQPPQAPVDLVTFSYSLTMIPDWFNAIDHAASLLKPGGVIGVTDFYVARKHPAPSHRRHGWLTRHGWPIWFASDNVSLSPDLLPYLRSRFIESLRTESVGPVPYLPFVRVPHFVFIGHKPVTGILHTR